MEWSVGYHIICGPCYITVETTVHVPSLYYLSFEKERARLEILFFVRDEGEKKGEKEKKKPGRQGRFLWLLIGCDKRGDTRAEDYIILLSKWDEDESAF